MMDGGTRLVNDSPYTCREGEKKNRISGGRVNPIFEVTTTLGGLGGPGLFASSARTHRGTIEEDEGARQLNLSYAISPLIHGRGGKP